LRMSGSQAPADLKPRDFLYGGGGRENARGRRVPGGLRRVGAVLLGLLVAIGFPPALAQTAKEDSVAKRARADYDPLGVESRDLLARLGIPANPATGSFLIFPKFKMGVEHDDNIFRIEEDVRSDSILRFQPSVRVKSDWDNHALNFSAGANVGRFNENGSEDYEDYNFGTSGRVDLSERTRLGAGIAFSKAHTARSSPDDSGLGVPLTENVETTYNLNAAFKGERFSFRLVGKAEIIDFDDAGPINNDDQDRAEYEGRFRVGYEFVVGTTLFVEPRYNIVEYDDTFDDSGLQRSGGGYEVQGGFSWDISGVTFLELGAGFLQQKRDDTLLKTIDGVSFSGDFIWNATDMLTLTSRLSRSVEETTILDATGILTTEWGLAMDYDPLENLIFNLEGAFKNEKFEGVSREEDTIKFQFGAKYIPRPHFVAELKYSFAKRDSNEVGESFKDNRWVASLTLRL